MWYSSVYYEVNTVNDKSYVREKFHGLMGLS